MEHATTMDQQQALPYTQSPPLAPPPHQHVQPDHGPPAPQPQPPAISSFLGQLLPAIAATQEALARLTPQQHQRVAAYISSQEQRRAQPQPTAASGPGVAVAVGEPGGPRPCVLISQQLLQQLQAAVYHAQRAAYHAHRLQEARLQRAQEAGRQRAQQAMPLQEQGVLGPALAKRARRGPPLALAPQPQGRPTQAWPCSQQQQEQHWWQPPLPQGAHPAGTQQGEGDTAAAAAWRAGARLERPGSGERREECCLDDGDEEVAAAEAMLTIAGEGTPRKS